MPIYPKNRF